MEDGQTARAVNGGGTRGKSETSETRFAFGSRFPRLAQVALVAPYGFAITVNRIVPLRLTSVTEKPT